VLAPDEICRVLAWFESHSGTTSFISLILAILSALFKPAIWRKLVASTLVGLTGFLFLPYNPANNTLWIAKASFLALAFIFAFWWLLERLHSLRGRLRPQPIQPPGTFETAVEAVTEVIAQSGDSAISTRLSTDAGTFTFTKRPIEKKDSKKER
jgi:hypothetical protein